MVAVCIPFLAALVGCSSAKESASPPPRDPSREFEKEFDPRKYDPKDKTEPPAEGNRNGVPEGREPAAATTAERLERLSGFRIQIYSTNDLDDAVRAKTSSQASLDSMKVYMVYDAPYYKIRVGDFLAKSDADRAKDSLKERGFSEAWVVPDKVSRTVSADER